MSTLTFDSMIERAKYPVWASNALQVAIDQWLCFPNYVILVSDLHPDFCTLSAYTFPDVSSLVEDKDARGRVMRQALGYGVPLMGDNLHDVRMIERAERYHHRLKTTYAQNEEARLLAVSLRHNGKGDYRELALTGPFYP